jgi:putative exporter of polyketide antibiotics
VTDGDLRWSWYLPAARSCLARSFSTRNWSAALFTATAAIVNGLAFRSRHSRFVQ